MKLKRKNIIVKCAADLFMPLAAMFGIYVIMHGDSSPGGGFQEIGRASCRERV